MGHLLYKWLNYYVRMSKNVVWDPNERFPLGDSVFCVGRTQWVVLSAAATQNRVKNAHAGPKRRFRQAPTAVGGTSAAYP